MAFVDPNSLYILIEGEPQSPESEFLDTAIGDLIDRSELPNVDFDLIQVGSSQAFNSMARLIYAKSHIHKQIPILAITDRDFTIATVTGAQEEEEEVLEEEEGLEGEEGVEVAEGEEAPAEEAGAAEEAGEE